MDQTSLQSIEQRMVRPPIKSVIENTEYMQNLKSECYFKENALKTAENLIEEYHRENQELKLQIVKLNLKIQNYEQRIDILRHQVEIKDTSNAKSFQKQLIKSANKLSKVLEKYSELQSKYHLLQKELAKYKFYKQQNEERIFKENNKKEKALKIQIEKQFDNFLRTPASKETMFKTNPSTSKKISAPKNKNFKDLKLADFESESNQQDKTKQFYESSGDESKDHIMIGDKLFDRKPSIKKSAQKINKMYQKAVKEKSPEGNDKVHQRLKVLEWKLKEKDEEIILMLRRNKQVEMKYNILKEILQDQRKLNPVVNEDDDSAEEKKKDSMKGKKNDSLQTNPTLKSNRHYDTESRKEDKKSEEVRLDERKISEFGLDEGMTTSKWKNYKTYKFN